MLAQQSAMRYSQSLLNPSAQISRRQLDPLRGNSSPSGRL